MLIVTLKMENLTLESETELCMICREEDQLSSTEDSFNKIKHLVHESCADSIKYRNCPLCQLPEFSVIKRSGAEVDKQELHTYYGRLVQTFKESENFSVRFSSLLKGIIENELEINNLLNDFVIRFEDKLV